MRVIAEWGQTNRGSVERACVQAAEAAKAGCWAAKWQLLTPEAIAAPNAAAYWAHATEGEMQAETFRANGMIDYGAWQTVMDCCNDHTIAFLATPFDTGAVEALDRMDVWGFKIASGDITNSRLLDAVAACGRNVILSTGASTIEEVEWALERLAPSPTTLLACGLVYPCPDEEAQLHRIGVLLEEFPEHAVGYSDHTFPYTTALAAAACGARYLEKHCTLNPGGPTPDDQMGLRPIDLYRYVELARVGEAMRGQWADRLVPSLAEQPARVGARRAWHAVRDIPAGTVLRDADLAPLRPCPGGVAGANMALVGRTLVGAVPAGEPIPLTLLAPLPGWQPAPGGNPRRIVKMA